MRARAIGLALFAITFSLAAYVFFASRPPMQVLRGFEPISAWVPPLYQASVFPSFAWFVGASIAGPLSRGERMARALLILLTGGLSLIRLLGALPLSGHALFLCAVLSFGCGRARRLHPLDIPAYPLAFAGLCITAFYKFSRWNDTLYGALSIAFGAGIGMLCALMIKRLELSPRLKSHTAPPPPCP